MPSIMDFIIAAGILYCIVSAIGHICLFAQVCIEEDVEEVDYYLNPMAIYESREVNIFGCIMLTIFFNVFFILHAIWFWFYKLCTVGRR